MTRTRVMYLTSKLRQWVIIGLVCLLVINNPPVRADPGPPPKNSGEKNDNAIASQTTPSPPGTTISSATPSLTCIQCGTPPPCPACPSGKICALGLQTCGSCPQPKCIDIKTVPNVPPDLSSSNTNNSSKANAKLVPAVIGGVLGIGVLTAAGYGYMKYKGKGRRFFGGEKIASSESKVWGSADSENVIPIAYIPPAAPTTPTTPKPDPTYQRNRLSYLSIGTTPLTTPLASPMLKTYSEENLAIHTEEDEEIFSEVGTIFQATKTVPTAATVVTATRAKPALVRLNTIKSNNNQSDSKSLRSTHTDPSAPHTPKTPPTGNTLLSVQSPSKSSVPNSPTFHSSTGVDDDVEAVLLPRIDIETSSIDSSLSARNSNNNTNTNNEFSSDHLGSPFSDPLGARQSFGLFSSDEVELQRESMISSHSSNARSTLMSDEGEIMIFWGGNTPTSDTTNRVSSSSSGALSPGTNQTESIKDENKGSSEDKDTEKANEN